MLGHAEYQPFLCGSASLLHLAGAPNGLSGSELFELSWFDKG